MHIVGANIYIAENLLLNQEFFSGILPDAKLVIVSDQNVAMHYLSQLVLVLEKYSIDTLILPAGETNKTWQNTEKIMHLLIKKQHDRNTILISLGGGVIADMVGFVASIYMRGMKLIHIPTSLLAQIDACIGGKTGFNYLGLKNILGTFYPAQAIIIDPLVLHTLSKREYISGLAEAVKYGMACDADFFIWLEENCQQILNRDLQRLVYLIQRCCEIKSSIIKQDMHDLGERRILNFGHTYAHAIEAASGFNHYLHGEAVAIGMLLATKLAVKLEICDISLCQRLENLILKFGLPSKLNHKLCSLETVNTKLLMDKKKHSAQLTLILPYDLGRVRVVENLMDEYVRIR